MEPLSPLLVAQIGREVAAALHCAHGLTVNGVPVNPVHRDVTPHNVLLSYEGAVKLTDFGIAKAGNRLSAVGVLKGKFAYMSPEQARGEAVDHRTDVFALGIVLWELLTGGRLFEGDSDLAVLRAVQQSAIASPRRLNPEVSPALDEAVMTALAREPGARFQTAQALERALAAYVFATADSYDDTDVGGYLRKLFADELELERALEQPPVPSPRVASPEVKLSPGQGSSGTLVLAHGQRPVIAEPPPLPAEPASQVPLEPTHPARALPSRPPAPPEPAVVARASQVARTPRWPIVAGGVVLLGVLAVVGVRGRHAPAGSGAPTAGGPVPGTPGKLPSEVASAQTADPAGGRQVAAPPATVKAPPERPPAEARPAEVHPLGAAAPANQGTPPAPAKSAPAPSAVTISPAGGSAASAVEPAAAPKAALGTLVIVVFRWAKVWIDGEPKGQQVGTHLYRLPAGDHTIRFNHLRDNRTEHVHLGPGKRMTVRYGEKLTHH
jgi:serine/threonine-protein kinase